MEVIQDLNLFIYKIVIDYNKPTEVFNEGVGEISDDDK